MSESNDDAVQLKKCPFCPPEYCAPDLWCDGDGFWQVGHGSCGAQSGISKDKKAVLKHWNTRHINTDLEQQLNNARELIVEQQNKLEKLLEFAKDIASYPFTEGSDEKCMRDDARELLREIGDGERNQTEKV